MNKKPENSMGADGWLWLIKEQPQALANLQEGTKQAVQNALANYSKVPVEQQKVIDTALQRLLLSKDWEPMQTPPPDMSQGASLDAVGVDPEAARKFATVPPVQ